MLPTDNEKSPVFKKWRHWYVLVVSVLLLLILLFYLFTKHYS